MLVLTRRIGEEIIINENIVITINRIKGTTVSIGISAPKEMKIMRGELHSKAVGLVKQEEIPT